METILQYYDISNTQRYYQNIQFYKEQKNTFEMNDKGNQ